MIYVLWHQMNFLDEFLNYSRIHHFNHQTGFRIILAEYENGPVDSDIRSKLESTPKFTLMFGQDSLNFDQTTSRLFLKPTNMETIHDLNVLDGTKYDGTLTLGELQKDDFE